MSLELQTGKVTNVGSASESSKEETQKTQGEEHDG
jgi:hypothetical protein